jgi:hypothetical protein
MREFRVVPLLIAMTCLGALAPVGLCTHMDRSAPLGRDAAADLNPSANL